jgi:uncharacterized protein YdeI (YjbR/CyaY-like superfamily)
MTTATKQEVTSSMPHKLPADLKKALNSNTMSVSAWNSLTPIAQNEWICWNISVKIAETRKNHISRTVKELAEGKRRPCCWYGCIHRTDKPMNATQKWVTQRQSK